MAVSESVPSDAVPDFADAGSRRRLSGPGLRTFAKIAAAWQLSELEAQQAIGAPSAEIYAAWLAQALQHQTVELPVEVLMRISAILGVYGALHTVWNDDDAPKWLRSPNHGPVFAGATPISFLVSSSFGELLTLRRFLDAKAAGN